MTELFLNRRLGEISQKGMTSFHVPAHNGGKLFKRLGIEEYEAGVLGIDMTELPGTDNLHNPQDVILQAQNAASRIFGSDESFFLVNGTTGGIYAAIMSCLDPGGKLIMDRNSHMSAYNACLLGRIDPVYAASRIDEKRGIPLPASEESIERAIKENPDAGAVFVTSPTYYGDCIDISRISKAAHKCGMVLIVDAAHGSHLGLSALLPPSAIKSGADMAVCSIHKTLGSFTQSSMLHVKGERADRERLRSLLRIFQSTSPSYLLMSSLEMAAHIYEKHGERLMGELLGYIYEIADVFKGFDNIKLYEGKASGFDMTKLFVVTTATGVSGYEIEELLRENYKIQPEFSTPHGVLFVSTIGNGGSDFDALKAALFEIDKLRRCGSLPAIPQYPGAMPKAVASISSAFYMKKRLVPLEESKGCICGDYIIPYPPGIPLVAPGELIGDDVLEYVRAALHMGMHVNGVGTDENKSVKVIEMQ
ncbi:arginine decarboxylase SpeA [Peptoclostridium acidaminophilum DSM 3953]|uniref:Arginine decarboxylase SpeA n=1 Tax=Peptoclostridium acidaminophilum DSM 3953 TaxID=1286171 RepID=W8TH80_PEPAC|nr:aminotransferase class I/II-fold pyridoxal phosphate-dependent enzyme [Peptoclostridium acidaminophilum]AHM55552.1 arginine decarboxylase SpeA [Peptoclostridium acidaminophilum DSM 3953]